MKPLIAQELNLLDIAGIFLVLLMAFVFQFLLHELPCPLCLLQRLGLLGIAFGLLLNARFGIRPSHYALSILSALFTGAVATRQILLHIVPGTGGYGAPFLGLHLYTWVLLFSIASILIIALLMLSERQFQKARKRKNKTLTVAVHVLFLAITLATFANAFNTYAECGFSTCPDDPTQYYL